MKPFRKLFSIHFWPAYIWLLLVTYLSLVGGGDVQGIKISIPHFDKFVHFCFYFGFVFLSARGCSLLFPHRKFWSAVIISAVFYGGVMELLQMFTPDRSADWFDLMANSIGALVAALSFNMLQMFFNKLFKVKRSV